MKPEDVQRIADLEWANYAATLAAAQVTPGLDVVMREDLIITSSALFPTPDANHACLLRADPQSVDALIDEIVDHFRSKEMPATLFVSPACTPAGLADRLLERGFARQKEQEAWMVLENLAAYVPPAASPRVDVRQIDQRELPDLARVFLSAFELPAEYEPFVAQLLSPSVGLPGVHHYLAYVGGEPVGTCSLLCYERYGVLGSAGVVPAHRGSRALTGLAAKAYGDARAQNLDIVMLQTAANTLLERFLRISGFKRAFTRTCYTLA